jgi:very-short-patch-repair endonuclease/endogenous inhibitor of DNA gyrase (YacG/DUF329 family)
MKQTNICKNCNKEFSFYPSPVKGRGTFCSRRCKADYSIKHSGSTRKCPVCGNTFYAKGNPKTRICCSRKCASEQRKTGNLIKCLLCGKEVYKPKNQLDRASNSFCSQLCANRYQKETDQKDRMRKNGTKSILKQLKNKKPTKLEIAGNKILSEIGISFKEQVPMFEKFIVDVLIEEKKIVIQWDGEYWHLKKTNKDRDNSQDKYLQKCGYFVLRYTDKQIKKDREWVKKDIITKLNQ